MSTGVVPRLFASPAEILAVTKRRAIEQDWPIAESIWDELARDLPGYSADPLVGPCIDIWLGDLEHTVAELVGWLRTVDPGLTVWEPMKFDSEHLRLVDPDRYGPDPSARWTVVDFGANFTPASDGTWASRDETAGVRPIDVRDKEPAGLELLSAFVVHPDYLPNLDYQVVPGFWIPGLEVSIDGEEPWCRTPQLALIRGPRFLMLFGGFSDHRDCYYSLPLRLETAESLSSAPDAEEN